MKKTTIKHNALNTAIFLVSAYSTPFSTALAADKYWGCNTESWDSGEEVGGCWSDTLNGFKKYYQPLDGDDVYLYNTTSNNKTVYYWNEAYPSAILNSLNINATGSGTMSLLLNQDGHSLSTLTETIGIDGDGIVTQTAGTHSVTNDLILGYSNTGNGTISVSNTGILSNGGMTIGYSGSGSLSVTNGGSVISSGDVAIGRMLEGSGTATVNGTGSTWTSTGYFDVGMRGAGVLNIINGGTVNSGESYIGTIGSAANGVVTVDSTGSTWNTGLLYVGNQGNGTLNITNGGDVNSTNGAIGENGGSTGHVFVDGTGSTWFNSGYLAVGLGLGASTLTISNGGSVVTSFSGEIYDSSVVTVNGAGSSWTMHHGLVDGALNIQNGGSVSSNSASLAEGLGVTASTTVDGAGSSWDISGDLGVGGSGVGILNVINGGGVTSLNAYLGYYTDGSGSVIVDGPGSFWNIGNDLYVGGYIAFADGAGDITLQNGGTLDVGNNLTIWDTGTVSLQNGTTLNVGADLVVSDNSVLNLNGGAINAGSIRGSGSGLHFNAGTLNITSDLVLESAGPLSGLVLNSFKTLAVNGITTLDGYSTLTLDGGTFSTGSLVNNGGFAFNSGTLNLTNDNLVIGAGGLFGNVVQFGITKTVNVSNTTTINSGAILSLANGSFTSGSIINNGTIDLDGSIALLGGGTVSNNGVITGDGRVSATLNNNTAGEIRSATAGSITFSGSGNTNDGRMNMLGGIMEFTNDLTNNGSGVITGHGALITGTGLTNHGTLAFTDTTDVLGNVNNDTGGSIIVSGNTTTFYDDVVHNGTEIRVTSNSQAVFFGTVSGAGAYTGSGEVVFAGDVLPGNSPALITMAGDLVLADTANTLIELGGLVKGDEYDAFDIGGQLTLGGDLNVVMYDMGGGLFEPSLGDTFDIFSAEVITGDFDLITLWVLGGGLDWKFDYLVDEIGTIDMARLSVVSAVPVPASVWLFGSGLIGLIGVARRNKE